MAIIGSMDDGDYVVGDTRKFLATVTRDGVIWDLTDAVVTLTFRNPGGVAAIRTATIVSAAAGTVQYTTTTADLSSAGIWERTWKVVQGIVQWTREPIRFRVQDSPTAAA